MCKYLKENWKNWWKKALKVKAKLQKDCKLLQKPNQKNVSFTNFNLISFIFYKIFINFLIEIHDNSESFLLKTSSDGSENFPTVLIKSTVNNFLQIYLTIFYPFNLPTLPKTFLFISFEFPSH